MYEEPRPASACLEAVTERLVAAGYRGHARIYLLAETLSESTGGDLEEAIAVARKACALEPGYEPAIDLLANLYLRAGQPALAEHQADLALARDPNDSVALFAKIRAKHKLGQEAEVPALVTRLELSKKDDLARTQQLSHYKLTETHDALLFVIPCYSRPGHDPHRRPRRARASVLMLVTGELVRTRVRLPWRDRVSAVGAP